MLRNGRPSGGGDENTKGARSAHLSHQPFYRNDVAEELGVPEELVQRWMMEQRLRKHRPDLAAAADLAASRKVNLHGRLFSAIDATINATCANQHRLMELHRTAAEASAVTTAASAAAAGSVSTWAGKRSRSRIGSGYESTRTPPLLKRLSRTLSYGSIRPTLQKRSWPLSSASVSSAKTQR